MEESQPKINVEKNININTNIQPFDNKIIEENIKEDQSENKQSSFMKILFNKKSSSVSINKITNEINEKKDEYFEDEIANKDDENYKAIMDAKRKEELRIQAEKMFLDVNDRPFTYEQAEKHSIANKIYNLDKFLQENIENEKNTGNNPDFNSRNLNEKLLVSNDLLSKIDFCECCQMPLPLEGLIEKYPVCTSIKTLSKINQGLYFYLFYIQTISIFLLTFFILMFVSFDKLSYSTVQDIIKQCRIINDKTSNHSTFNMTYDEYIEYFSLINLNENYNKTLTNICKKYNTRKFVYLLSIDSLYDFIKLKSKILNNKTEEIINRFNITDILKNLSAISNVTFIKNSLEHMKDNIVFEEYDQDGEVLFAKTNINIIEKIISRNETSSIRDVQENEKILYNLMTYYFNSNIIIMIFLAYLTIALYYNITIQSDILTLSPSDYTLMVSNLSYPLRQLTNQNLKKLLSMNTIQPLDIIRTYKLEKYLELKKKFYEFVKIKLKMFKKNQNYLEQTHNIICKKIITLEEINKNILDVQAEMLKFVETSINVEVESKFIRNSITSNNDDSLEMEDEFENMVEVSNLTGVIFLIFSSQKECAEYKKMFTDSYIKVMKKDVFIMFSNIKNSAKTFTKSIAKGTNNVKNFIYSVIYKITFGYVNLKKSTINSKKKILNLFKLGLFGQKKENNTNSEKANDDNSKQILTLDDLETKNSLYSDLENLIIEDAPDPNDILWENLQYSRFSQLTRSIFIYLISLLLIFISFAIVLAIASIQVS